MITGEQIRMALGALRWSRRILSEKSGVPEKTIQRAAEAHGVPSTNAQHLTAMQVAFEQGNEFGRIEFLNTTSSGARFHPKEKE